MFVVFAAAGDTALRRVRLQANEPAVALSYATAVGAALFSVLVLCAGTIGLLRPSYILLSLATLTLLLFQPIRRVARLIQQAAGQIRTDFSRVPYTPLLVGLTGIVVLLTILLASAPPSDWDSLMYHLQVPAHFLHRGRIFVPEDNLHFSRIGLQQLLYVFPLSAGIAAGGALISVLFAINACLATYSLIRAVAGGFAAAVTACAFWAATTIVLVAATPRVDVTVVFYLLLGQHAGIVALRDRRGRDFALAGAFLGCAFGVKYHAAVYATALAALIVIRTVMCGQNVR